jgi:type I restriction enzyme S subunit
MTYKLIEYSIEDIAEIVGGGTPSSKVEEYYGGSVPWITPKDLSGYNDVYISKGNRNITELGLSRSSAKMLPENAVLFTSRAPIGYVALAGNPVCTNQGFKSLIPKEDILDYKFAYYLMKFYAPQIEASASGTTFKEISGGALKSFKVKIPESVEAQKNIADILFKLDSKISNNTAMNATLEKIAQRIFKSWFIDFDPVKANAESVQFDGLSPEIQALFPNEFEESELGMVPEGWEVNTASNSFKVYGGYAFKSKDFTESGTPVIKIKNISSNRTVDVEGSNCVESFDEKKLKKFVLSDGDILMAMTGATVGKSGIFANLNSKALLNQRVAKITGINDETCWFSYLNVISDSFFDTVVKQAYGSAQPNISSNDIGNIKIITPTENIKAKFNKLMTPLFERWITNRNQEQLLSKIRDKLLPRLISGKITIQKAEELLEEAS